jgi:hypothetical protein
MTPSESSEKGDRRSFVPPSREDKKTIVTTAVLNIDGQQLAQTIASQLANIYENSPNASSANGLAYFDVDTNPIA